MSACFNMLAINIVIRRGDGVVEAHAAQPAAALDPHDRHLRQRLIVSAVQVVLLLVVGRYGYGAQMPSNWLALVVALFTGVVCFTALGVAASTSSRTRIRRPGDLHRVLRPVVPLWPVVSAQAWLDARPGLGLVPCPAPDHRHVRTVRPTPGSRRGPGTTSRSWRSGEWWAPSWRCAASGGRR